jgi:hypothetical protein
MRTTCIVIPYEFIAGLLWGHIIVQIQVFILKSSPEPFREDIVQGAPLAIHARLHMALLQSANVLIACKVTPLIAVPYFRRCPLKRGVLLLGNASNLGRSRAWGGCHGSGFLHGFWVFRFVISTPSDRFHELKPPFRKSPTIIASAIFYV